MATRTLLCMEPDDDALGIIASTLEPYGFAITNLANGDQVVEWARHHRPELMMVSVEPKKVGYAICNKIKRSAELKDVPLILMSSDESPEKFEQHKSFKLRADDYMFKPLDRHELMRKVNVLVGLDGEGLGPAPSASAEIFMGSDVVSSEIAIDPEDIVDETKLETPAPVAGAGLGEGPLGGVLDAMFDKEADAAFDALELPAPPASGPAAGKLTLVDSYLSSVTPPPAPSPGPALVAVAPAPGSAPAPASAPEVAAAPETGAPPEAGAPQAERDDDWTEGAQEATRAALPAFLVAASAPDTDGADASDMTDTAPPTVSGVVASAADQPTAEVPAPLEVEVEGDPELLRKSAARVEEDVPLPEEVRNTSVVGGASSVASDAAFSELQKRIHELEDEKRELASVIEDLRTHLQAQPLHKERDLLSLRETINRKEKDVLDLRDALDAKDRQLLDQKDRMREHERARRDLEEKMITFEKNLMHASEKAFALAQDKEKALERERGLKARLEDAHGEIAKNHDELDVLKRRLATLEDRARAEVDRVRSELEARLSEDEEAHKNELARLREDREAEKAAREAEVQAEIGRINTAHAAESEQVSKRHAEEKASLEDAHELELARMRREHEKSLAALREEHSAALESAKHEHQVALEDKEREGKNELAELRRGHEAALAAAEDQRRRELEEAEVKRIGDLDAADARRRNELQARDEQHHAAVAEGERRNLQERTEMVERHRAELEQVQSRASAMEADIAARSEELAETHRRLLRVEGELDTARADVRDREVKLGQARDRVTELESKIADLEDQALRAYRRIKDDEKAIDRAKRAVAVALTVLDERPSGAAAQPTLRPTEESKP